MADLFKIFPVLCIFMQQMLCYHIPNNQQEGFE